MDLPNRETLSVEFKSDTTGDAKKRGVSDSTIIDAVIALSNTNGGVLYLGVEDDGTPTGLNPTRHDLFGLEALVANRTVPSVRVLVEPLEVNGITIMAIHVPCADTVTSTSDGRMLRRAMKLDGTPESIPMYPYEIATRLGDLNKLDYSAQTLPGATLDDLDPLEVVRLRRLVASSPLADKALEVLEDEELLASLGLVKEQQGKLAPTVAGVLVLGTQEALREHVPTATCSFQVLQGSKVRLNDEGPKPILAAVELFESYFDAQNTVTEVESGLYSIPVPDFSRRAFREALVNAFSHRDYTLLRSVRVLIDDDGLTINSPGGFVSGITFKNILTAAPHGRNPVLAECLKRIGLAEKTGRSVNRIVEESLRYGRSMPDYSESTASDVTLLIPREVCDATFYSAVRSAELKTGKALSAFPLMVLATLRDEGELGLEELVARTGLGATRLRRVLSELLDAELIESAREGSYKVAAALARDSAREASAERAAKRDALILDLVKRNGSASRSEVAELLGVTPVAARTRLGALVSQGQLEIRGTGRGARYYLRSQ